MSGGSRCLIAVRLSESHSTPSGRGSERGGDRGRGTSITFPDLPTYLFEPSLAGVLSLAVAILLPLLAALLMKSAWSAFRKGLVLLALATIKAFLEAWLGAANSGEHFDLWRTM